MQLIQYGTNNPFALASPFDSVWTKHCSAESENNLEQLLFLVKQRRNKVGHKDESVLNLTNEELQDICESLKVQLVSIIQQAGNKSQKLEKSKIDQVCTEIGNQIDEILGQNYITSFDKAKVLEYIRKDDLEKKYANDLEDYFSKELKGYTPPSFVNKLSNKEIAIKHILTDTESKAVAIEGDVGYGKTALTK